MPCPLHVCAPRFDCILLDIMMARTNGVDVAIALQLGVYYSSREGLYS